MKEEVMQMREVPFISDWIKEAEEEAAKRGRQEGLQQARREAIIDLLEDKFGVVNGSILEFLEKVNRIESLRMLLKRVPKVETQDEFQDLIKIALGK